MSYPNYPKNRLIIKSDTENVDLTEKFGLILSDGYTLEPPEPKIYSVDIPGGDGIIDLTEALTGYTVYQNRKQEFIFYAIAVEDFEKLKTKLSNFLHGKSFDYMITMDPGYTYHGRFKVSSYEHNSYSIGIVGAIKISIDADPYKSKGHSTQIYNSTVGAMAYPINGHKSVQPRIEFSHDTIVIFGDKKYSMPAGCYTFEDIWFKEGTNKIFFMSAKARSYITNEELSIYTLNHLKTNQPIYKWYAGIPKYYVDTITLTPNGSNISGEITFTATDQGNNTFESSVDLGDFVMHSIGDVSDTLEIKGQTARFIRRISNDSGELAVDIEPTVITFEFKELFSNTSDIANVTNDTDGIMTYTKSSINTQRLYHRAIFSDYSEDGDYAMTMAQLNNLRIMNIEKVYTDSDSILDNKEELVYLDYEMIDL